MRARISSRGPSRPTRRTSIVWVTEVPSKSLSIGNGGVGGSANNPLSVPGRIASPRVPVDDVDVTVRFFAAYREVTGLRETRVPVRAGATLGELVDRILDAHPALRRHRESMLLAVNEEFAEPAAPPEAGDEGVVMPPVRGGRGRAAHP